MKKYKTISWGSDYVIKCHYDVNPNPNLLVIFVANEIVKLIEMKKIDIEHIQRCRFLASKQKFTSNIDKIVQSINYKYPEIAKNIEIPNDNFSSTNSSYFTKGLTKNYLLDLFDEKKARIVC